MCAEHFETDEVFDQNATIDSDQSLLSDHIRVNTQKIFLIDPREQVSD